MWVYGRGHPGRRCDDGDGSLEGDSRMRRPRRRVVAEFRPAPIRRTAMALALVAVLFLASCEGLGTDFGWVKDGGAVRGVCGLAEINSGNVPYSMVGYPTTWMERSDGTTCNYLDAPFRVPLGWIGHGYNITENGVVCFSEGNYYNGRATDYFRQRGYCVLTRGEVNNYRVKVAHYWWSSYYERYSTVTQVSPIVSAGGRWT